MNARRDARHDRGADARTDAFEVLNPAALGEPRGWNHGLLAPPGGRVLFVAGQTATGPGGGIESADFAEQFALVLDRVLAVVGRPAASPRTSDG